MDPFEFIWEIAKTLFGLISAVALPAAAIWFIARQQRQKRDRTRSR
ncbi:hypothetical protein BH23CHL3_BH23CHL3_07330 [soil metagenome]|jgi:flagellar biogenesis protein FliO